MSKRRNHIDIRKAKEVMTDGYGLEVQEINWYQFRLRHEGVPGFHDWYHTTGSLVYCNEEGYNSSAGTIEDPEEVAIFISKQSLL